MQHCGIERRHQSAVIPAFLINSPWRHVVLDVRAVIRGSSRLDD